MSIDATPSTPEAAIGCLLGEARRLEGERRSHDREPYFRPVIAAFTGGARARETACFSRDISPSGIGLIHDAPVEPGETLLTIDSVSSGPIRLRAEIIWCEACGNGWYLSGARFDDEAF